jgi:hypothetical protein
MGSDQLSEQPYSGRAATAAMIASAHPKTLMQTRHYRSGLCEWTCLGRVQGTHVDEIVADRADETRFTAAQFSVTSALD